MSARSFYVQSSIRSILWICLLGHLYLGAWGQPSGPALYGDPKFWVKLASIVVSPGDLKPVFDPDSTEYSVTVENPQTKTLQVRLVLALSKYSHMFLPAIHVDGLRLKYNPVDPVIAHIPLNQTVGAFDRMITIKVSDPQKDNGWSMFQHKTEYHLRIMQPPEFEKVLLAQAIIVTSQQGIRIESDPPFDNTSSNVDYHFGLRSWESIVNVNLQCSQYATGVSYNGKPAAPGASTQIEVRGLLKTLLAQCLYSDPKWSKAPQQRTYVLTFSASSSLKYTSVEINVLPEEGLCKPKNPTDPMEGYRCHVLQRHLNFIVFCNNSKVEMTLVNEVTGKREEVENGLPVPMVVSDHSTLQLVLDAGQERRKYPIKVTFPALCGTLSCPTPLLPRPVSVIASKAMCRASTCTEDDIPTCCTEKGTCAGVDCPVGYFYHPVPECAIDKEVGLCRSEACCSTENIASCSTFQCPKEYRRKTQSEFIFCQGAICSQQDMTTCCTQQSANQTCKTMQCHDPFFRRKGSDDKMCSTRTCTDHDVETCCDAPGGFGKKMTCSEFECPANYIERGSPATICHGLFCIHTCCVKAAMCSSFQCPDGYKQHSEASKLSCGAERCSAEQDISLCCNRVPQCSLYRCSFGLVLKPHAFQIRPHVLTDDVCCEARARCSSYSCPEGYLAKEAAGFCSGASCTSADTGVCCEKTRDCIGFQCPARHILRSNAGDLSCSGTSCSVRDADICCQQAASCTQHECPMHFLLKQNAQNLDCKGPTCDSSDTQRCCDLRAMCDTFTCPYRYSLKEDAEYMECAGQACGDTDITMCCDEMEMCSEVQCPRNHVMKMGHEHTWVTELERMWCCTEAASCPSVSCPDGFTLKPNSSAIKCAGHFCSDTDLGVCCEVLPDKIEDKGEEETKQTGARLRKVTMEPVEASAGSCTNYLTGFWCQSVHRTIALVVKFLYMDDTTRVEHLQPMNVPDDGVKHVTVLLQDKHIATSQISVWLSHHRLTIFRRRLGLSSGVHEFEDSPEIFT